MTCVISSYRNRRDSEIKLSVKFFSFTQFTGLFFDYCRETFAKPILRKMIALTPYSRRKRFFLGEQLVANRVSKLSKTFILKIFVCLEATLLLSFKYQLFDILFHLCTVLSWFLLTLFEINIPSFFVPVLPVTVRLSL